VTTGHRPEHQDDREQPGRCGRSVLQELQAGIAGGQALGGEARADDHSREECAAEQLGEQAPPQRHVSLHG
jgi:hypothetical protein